MKQAFLDLSGGKMSPLKTFLSIALAALLFTGMVAAAGLEAAHAEEEPAATETAQGQAPDGAGSGASGTDASGAQAASDDAGSGASGATNDTSKEEVVYARLAGDGAVEGAYVVNVLNPGKAGTVTDYGNYASVQNLTDTGELALDGDTVTAEVTEESFSYQGDCISQDLPWDITITYALDGKPTAAADLAGAEGTLEVAIATKQNKTVDPSFFENYLLQISVVFPGDKSSEVSAPDGQIALAGSNTQVTFTGMPGKEGSFKAGARIHDFEMEGISVAAVPFGMALETPDTDEFVSGFEKLGDGVGQLKTGVEGIASGTQSLSSGINQMGTGVQGVADGASSLASGLTQVAGYSEQIMQGLNQAAAGGDQIATTSTTINSGLQGLSQAAGGVQAMMTTDDEVIEFMKFHPEFAYAVGGLAQGVQETAGGYTQFDSGLQSYVGGVNQIAGEYPGFNDGLSSLSSGANDLASGAGQLSGGFSSLSSGASELASGAGQLSEGTGTLYTEVQGMPATVREEIDKMMADYDKSDFKSISFTSPKNTNVTLVQFVIAGEPIKLPEDEEAPEPEEEGTMLSRLLALFGVES